MGKTKDTSSSTQSQSTQYTATPEERAYNELILNREKALDPQIRDVQSQSLSLVGQLLKGETLPGYLGKLPAGISPEVTQSIVNDSLNSLNVQLQKSGAGTILESGASQAVAGKVAGETFRAAEEFNLGNLLNLLNLATGAPAQVQQPILGYSSLLSQNLQGLRSVNQTGTASGTSTRKYDFFTSPLTNSIAGGFSQGFGAGFGTLLKGCWVAAEIFGGWNKIKTLHARVYMNLMAPKWLRNFYMKHGERMAAFIKNKPAIKVALRPLFEIFVKKVEAYHA